MATKEATYNDPMGALAAIREYLAQKMSGVEDIRAGAARRTRQFFGSTGSAAGSMAGAFAQGRSASDAGAEVARQQREDFENKVALRSSFLDPQYAGYDPTAKQTGSKRYSLQDYLKTLRG